MGSMILRLDLVLLGLLRATISQHSGVGVVIVLASATAFQHTSPSSRRTTSRTNNGMLPVWMHFPHHTPQRRRYVRAFVSSDHRQSFLTNSRPTHVITLHASSMPEVHVEETFHERPIENGEVLMAAMRAFASDGLRTRELCTGVLVQNTSTAETRDGPNMCGAYLSDSSDPNITGFDDRILMDGALQLLDRLFRHYLILERNDRNGREWNLSVHGKDSEEEEGSDGPLFRAAHARGFRRSHHDDAAVLSLDLSRAVRQYTESAFANRGTASGITSLEILQMLSERRVPYQYNDPPRRGVVSAQRQLLSTDVTSAIVSIMEKIEINGWLDTSSDTVDNAPKFGLTLLSDGVPLFSPEHELEGEENFSPALLSSVTNDLLALIRPRVYGVLLPRVRELMNSSTVEISDIFLRRYGEDIQPADGNSCSARNGITAHYDMLSLCTAVIALDDVAAEGKSGLYTIVSGSAGDDSNCGTSKHAALRRYFPLRCGDGVVHSWDILHGVDIKPGSNRTSLIVWFSDGMSEKASAQKPSKPVINPWLAEPDECDEVGVFILGSVLESGQFGSQEDRRNERMGSRSSTLMAQSSSAMSSRPLHLSELHPHDLYIQSASLGNALALFCLGLACKDKELDSSRVPFVLGLLDVLRPSSSLNREKFSANQSAKDNLSPVISNENIDFALMARRLWFEGAMRGIPLAQVSLAEVTIDAAMESIKHGESDLSSTEDMRLKAAVLFSLAAQQGYGDAGQSLARLVDLEYMLHCDEGIGEPDSSISPVVATANAATGM